MTTEQFFKYAEKCAKSVATIDVRTVKPYLEDLHVGILPTLIFLKLNK